MVVMNIAKRINNRLDHILELAINAKDGRRNR